MGGSWRDTFLKNSCQGHRFQHFTPLVHNCLHKMMNQGSANKMGTARGRHSMLKQRFGSVCFKVKFLAFSDLIMINSAHAGNRLFFSTPSLVHSGSFKVRLSSCSKLTSCRVGQATQGSWYAAEKSTFLFMLPWRSTGMLLRIVRRVLMK